LSQKKSYESLYTGVEQYQFSQGQIDRFSRDQCLEDFDQSFPPHLCLKLEAFENPQHQAIARFDQGRAALLPLRPIPAEGLWGITPRNVEQKFGLELLSHRDIHLVTLVGRAGTGKTLAGLQAVTEAQLYSRLLVSRPVFLVGGDLGFCRVTSRKNWHPGCSRSTITSICCLISMTLGAVANSGIRN